MVLVLYFLLYGFLSLFPIGLFELMVLIELSCNICKKELSIIKYDFLYENESVF